MVRNASRSGRAVVVGAVSLVVDLLGTMLLGRRVRQRRRAAA